MEINPEALDEVLNALADLGRWFRSNGMDQAAVTIDNLPSIEEMVIEASDEQDEEMPIYQGLDNILIEPMVPETGVILTPAQGGQWMTITDSTAISATDNGPGDSVTEWKYTVTIEGISSNGVGIILESKENPVVYSNVYNLCEYGNRDVGSGDTFGNGVKWDDMDEVTSSLQPVQNIPVWVTTFTYDDQVYGVFHSPNGITVEC